MIDSKDRMEEGNESDLLPTYERKSKRLRREDSHTPNIPISEPTQNETTTTNDPHNRKDNKPRSGTESSHVLHCNSLILT